MSQPQVLRLSTSTPGIGTLRIKRHVVVQVFTPQISQTLSPRVASRQQKYRSILNPTHAGSCLGICALGTRQYGMLDENRHLLHLGFWMKKVLRNTFPS